MIGAWASPQSRPLADRDELDACVDEVEERYRRARTSRARRTGVDISSCPSAIEFWQGQVGRLHDRFRYERDADERPVDGSSGSRP